MGRSSAVQVARGVDWMQAWWIRAGDRKGLATFFGEADGRQSPSDWYRKVDLPASPRRRPPLVHLDQMHSMYNQKSGVLIKGYALEDRLLQHKRELGDQPSSVYRPFRCLLIA